MKVALKITNYTPDRDYWRPETIKEPGFKKTKKTEDLTAAAKTEALKSTIIEIKREEAVYQFPKEGLEEYLAQRCKIKLEGCLGTIRNYFDVNKEPGEGGVRGLKKPFGEAWRIKVLEVRNIGDIVPMGLVRRFKYNSRGGKGGMGANRFDVLKEFILEVEVHNLPVERMAPNIFKQVIEYLPCTKLGRSGQIELVDS